MGIVQKQAIKGTVLTYSGAVLGFLTSAVLFPRILSTTEIGLIGVLISYSLIFAQFGSLGFASATTRMFPYFRTKDGKHHGFLFIAVAVSLIGFLVMLGIILGAGPFLLESKASKSPLLEQYFYWIIPLVFFTIFFNMFDHYNKVLFNAVRGIFLKEFVVRMSILIFLLIFYFAAIQFEYFLYAYILGNCIPAVAIFFLLMRERQVHLKPELTFLDSNMKKTIASVSLFGIIISATGIITLNIDRIMIEKMLGLDATGIYTTTFFFGTMIILPSRSLLKISSAIVSDAWKEKDMEKMNMMYYKTSLHQLIIGSLLLIGIWGNIDSVFVILTRDFIDGKYVILFIALAYLADMSTGVAGSILGNSPNYRVQALFMGIMVVLIVITNLIFIPIWGIVGAAFASFLSKLLLNLMRHIYIWVKFKIQPFDKKSLMVLVFAALAYLAVCFIPWMGNFVIDIFIRSIIMSVVFIFLILKFEISEEIQNGYVKYKTLAVEKLVQLRKK
jgi:O-antigen/teichoic acid export membrane protein